MNTTESIVIIISRLSFLLSLIIVMSVPCDDDIGKLTYWTGQIKNRWNTCNWFGKVLLIMVIGLTCIMMMATLILSNLATGIATTLKGVWDLGRRE